MNKLDKTFKINPLYEADSYKTAHPLMIAPGATREYWTWIPRSLKYMHPSITKVMSAGQQLVVRYLHSTFQEYFFDQNVEVAHQFTKDISKHLMQDYNFDGFEKLHKLGYLPIKIKALPEGLFSNPNIPHMTGVNTVDGYAWLGLFLETYISKLAWQLPTAATIGAKFRQNSIEWVTKTDPSNLWLVDYMNHDFHSRGGNPFTSIAVGLGHAMSNKGSDTLNVIPASRYYYDESEDEVPIYSVAASEHSVSCTKIFTVGEQQMIADWLQIFPKGILSIVSDTFDLWKLVAEYLPALKEEILARDGKLVIRPDSGDPIDIICGTGREFNTFYREELTDGMILPLKGKALNNAVYQNKKGETFKLVQILGKEECKAIQIAIEPSRKGVIELLWDTFGGTINEQGYKVLDPHIGAIYGDSINLDRQVEIYKRLEAKGFAATNIILGIGSYSYVYQTRDSCGYAAKGAWFETLVEKPCEIGKCKEDIEEDCYRDGCLCDPHLKQYNIYKDPITDDGVKRSLKGLLQVKLVNNEYIVNQECSWEQEEDSELRIIYEDGKFYNQVTLTQIRERLLLS